MKRKPTVSTANASTVLLYTPDSDRGAVQVDVIDLTDSPLKLKPKREDEPLGKGSSANTAFVIDDDDAPVQKIVAYQKTPDLNELYQKVMEIVLRRITHDMINIEFHAIRDDRGGTIRKKGWLGTGHILNFVGAIRLAGFVISDRVLVLNGHVLSMNSGPKKDDPERTLFEEETDYSARWAAKKKDGEWLARRKYSYRDNLGEELAQVLWEMLPRQNGRTYNRTSETVASIFKRLRDNSNGRPYIVLAPVMSNGNHWSLAHVTYHAKEHKLDLMLFDSLHRAENNEMIFYGSPDDGPVFHCRELIAAFHAMDPLTENNTSYSYGAQQHQGDSNWYDCSLFVCLAILRSIYGAVPDFSPLDGNNKQVSKEDIIMVRHIIAAMIAYDAEDRRLSLEAYERKHVEPSDVVVLDD